MRGSEHGPSTGDDPVEGTIHDLDVEVVEDLDVEDEADGVEGGTLAGSGGCPTIGCPLP